MSVQVFSEAQFLLAASDRSQSPVRDQEPAVEPAEVQSVLAGIPPNWSCPTSIVKKEDSVQICPWQLHPVPGFNDCSEQQPQVSKHKILSLFSGVGGLELGLSGCGSRADFAKHKSMMEPWKAA